MARPNPSLPHPSSTTVDPDLRLMREWRDLYAAMIDRLPVTGTSTFVASTSVAVTLTPNERDTSYSVFVEAVDDNYFRITSKAVTGFTITAKNSNSTTVRWALMRY